MITSGQSTRVAVLQGLFREGIKVEDLALDTAPWVRDGLRALEDGVELTADLLERADRAQNIALPERK